MNTHTSTYGTLILQSESLPELRGKKSLLQAENPRRESWPFKSIGFGNFPGTTLLERTPLVWPVNSIKSAVIRKCYTANQNIENRCTESFHSSYHLTFKYMHLLENIMSSDIDMIISHVLLNFNVELINNYWNIHNFILVDMWQYDLIVCKQRWLVWNEKYRDLLHWSDIEEI